MWERWGGPVRSDWPVSDTMGLLVGMYAGTIHGTDPLLDGSASAGGLKSQDPINHPGLGAEYFDRKANKRILGVGDLYFENLEQSTGEWAEQAEGFFGCSVDSMRSVYIAGPQTFGAIGPVTDDRIDVMRNVDSETDCWAQRVTNMTVLNGMGVYFGELGGIRVGKFVASSDFDVAGSKWNRTNSHLLAATLGGLAVKQRNELGGWDAVDLNPLEALAFGASTESMALRAAVVALQDPFGTDLAEGGLGPLAQIPANGSVWVADDLPAHYLDGALPWGVSDGSGLTSDEQAVSLAFAQAHAADRCHWVTAAFLDGRRSECRDGAAGWDAATRRAVCSRCAVLVEPHLDFGAGPPLCRYVKQEAPIVAVSGTFQTASEAAWEWCGPFCQ